MSQGLYRKLGLRPGSSRVVQSAVDADRPESSEFHVRPEMTRVLERTFDDLVGRASTMYEVVRDSLESGEPKSVAVRVLAEALLDIRSDAQRELVKFVQAGLRTPPPPNTGSR